MENSKEIRPFGIRDKIGYALGDFGCNMSFVFINSYMMLFFVTCLGIPASVYSVLILIAKIWDAINDPIIGALCDATRPKNGGSKFKLWIKWASLPLLILSVLMFIYIPDAPLWVKCVLCLVTYMFWSVAYTAVNVPYGSIQNVITRDPLQRTQLSTCRSIGSSLAQAPALIILPLILYDEQGNPKGNIMIYIVAVMGIIGYISFYLMRKLVTERVKYNYGSEKQKISYISTVKGFFRNKAMLGMTLSSFAVLAFIQTVTTTMPYVFMVYFQRPKLTSLGTVVAFVPMVIAMVTITQLSKRFTRKQIASVPFVLSALSAAILTFVKIENPYVWLGVLSISMLALGFYTILTWAMVADCIDYQESITGRREEGAIYATYSFFRKLAQGVGQSVIALAIGWAGYNELVSASQQATGVAERIYSVSGFLPFIGSVISFISLVCLYNLDEKRG